MFLKSVLGCGIKPNCRTWLHGFSSSLHYNSLLAFVAEDDN